MEKDYAAKNVQFVAINAAPDDTLIEMATQAVKYEVPFPCVKDFDGSCARALGVKRTPEVVVLDADKRICYRGRIDDQYRLSGNRKEPTSRDLQVALDAVLAGKTVANAETEVDGCPITFPKAREPNKAVNFAEHVAPLLAKHCWECHREGASAPFSLTSFKQAAARADSLAEAVSDQRMPPWFASHDFGPFVNRRGLSDEERTTLADWARAGAPGGDLAKAPAPPAPAKDKWQIGKPDLVLDSKVFDLPATGDIPYQYAILMHPFGEDTWVQGVQILSDNPRSLHHCNMAFVRPGRWVQGRELCHGLRSRRRSDEPRQRHRLPASPRDRCSRCKSTSFRPAKPEKARVSVGLRYAREVIDQRLRNMQLTDRRFAIPPGASAAQGRGQPRAR